MKRSGPLKSIKVLEIASMGPGPFCGMLLADMGADLLRIDRLQEIAPGTPADRFEVMSRGRRSLMLDLKAPGSSSVVLDLVERADVLIEGFRPGVMERLGLGPEPCLSRNPRLVYGRMTGWGQNGPMASIAGHDINYIALSGALHAIGGEKPVPPLNLVADFGGGGTYLAFGIVSALLEAARSGQGQVIDAAMTDGSASLMAPHYGRLASGAWIDRRGSNTLDGGAPWYGVYETADGKFVAVGAIEPQFYGEFVRRIGLDPAALPGQRDKVQWPKLQTAFAKALKLKTRDEWAIIFEGIDACLTPVLSMSEAPAHPHNLARHTFVEFEGVRQPAPAPRLSLTPGAIACPPPRPGEGGADAMNDWGFDALAIERFSKAGAKFE
ncbi:CaiB/BaiF CoA transferase family protein [Ferrovibrio sp.]|uniref:CaiB/BaiF CoA transferase family protein n=1 Tax=Ferrovibrio sp. TaxID=1917215 RepID=UPI003D2A6813